MKRSLAIAIVVMLGFVAASPAAGARGPTLRSLQAQITTLKKQVKTLKKRVARSENLAIGAIVYDGCGLAVTADALQNTWTTLNPAVFGPQTPVNDYTTCQAFRVVRARTQVPPTTSVFQSLLDFAFKSSSSAFAREVAVNLASEGRDLLGQLLVLPR